MTSVAVELAVTKCWCGMPFMVPATLLKEAHERAHPIYCPAGHKMVWTETNEDKLRQERDRLKQQLAYKDDELARERKQLVASKGQITKLKKRASAGTCPCCNRTFSNMGRHMKTKHPEFAQDTNVVPLGTKKA